MISKKVEKSEDEKRVEKALALKAAWHYDGSTERSQVDLHGYNDDEINSEPSLCDPSQDEPMEALVARLMRGEVLPSNGMGYDVQPGQDEAEVPVMERSGADIADIPPILAAGAAAAAAAAAASAAAAGAVTPPPVPAEKSQEGVVPAAVEPGK